MRAKRAHALTLAQSPPHCRCSQSLCRACERVCVHARRCVRSECVEELQRLLVSRVSAFTERGSYFMVFPATSCCFFFFCLLSYSYSICFSGECGGGGRKNIKNKHDTNMVSKTASFHKRAAPPNECETWRDFTFASERFAVCFARFCSVVFPHLARIQ